MMSAVVTYMWLHNEPTVQVNDPPKAGQAQLA
jgi:hypothetical protein